MATLSTNYTRFHFCRIISSLKTQFPWASKESNLNAVVCVQTCKLKNAAFILCGSYCK